MDLFARRCILECPLWYSQCPTDKTPLGANAFGPDPWPRELLYAFPPPVIPRPELQTREREGGRLINLVAPVNDSPAWFPQMCPLVQGQRIGPPHVGGRAVPGWGTADIPAQVWEAQPSRLDAVRVRYLARGADARVIEVLRANRTKGSYSKYEGLWNRLFSLLRRAWCGPLGCRHWSDLVPY